MPCRIRQNGLRCRWQQIAVIMSFVFLIAVYPIWFSAARYKISNINQFSLKKEENNFKKSDTFCISSPKCNGSYIPIIDFTIRTWRGDGHWLVFCLRSIEKFVPQSIYRKIIVTYDERENFFFRNYLEQFQATMNLTMIPQENVYIRPGPNKGGYYSTMWSKYHTFQLSDADYFIHVDSDTIFTRTVTLKDFLDSKCRVYVKRVPYTTLPSNYHDWKQAAEELFNETVEYETMTRFPFVYPRELYLCAIKHVEKVHRKPFLQVARKVTHFSDHSALGAYLIAHMPEYYVDYPVNMDNFILQSWSWVRAWFIQF